MNAVGGRDSEHLSLRIVNAPHLTDDEIRGALQQAIRKNSWPKGHATGHWQVTVQAAPDGYIVVVRIPGPPREYLGVGHDVRLVEALVEAVSRLVVKLRDDDGAGRSQSSRPDGLPRLADALRNHDDDQRGQFDDVVRAHLPELKRFVEHELTHLRSARQLSYNYPTADEIIDDTLVRALDDLPFRTEVTPISTWLVGLASDVLDHEVSLARHRDHEGLSGLAVKQVRRLHETSGHGTRDQRDAQWVEVDMRELEGPTTALSPEEGVASEELRAFLMEMLADLPAKWRRAVMLVHLDGESIDAAAVTLGMSAESINNALAHATAYLRARLEEEQVTLPESCSPVDYLDWPSMGVGYTADLEKDLRRLTDANQ